MVEQISEFTPVVLRNDAFVVEDLEIFDKIILSPGPGIPEEAGKLKEVICYYAGRKPIFGVCLGLQAIVEVFGGQLENLEKVFHGVSSEIIIQKRNSVLFKNLPKKFNVARYHSWIASEKKFPDQLEVTAKDNEGHIMALRHRLYDLYAVQFHPESILTFFGKNILANFLLPKKDV